MKSRLILFAVSLALIGGGISVHRASAATTLTSCQTITSNGSYVLGNNITTSGTCFSIRGNVTNVVFDGNGKTITSTSGEAVEVADYGSGTPTHVVIKNLNSPSELRTYGDAIRYVTFENLHVGGITVYGSDDVTITNNVVGANGISISNADQTGWAPYRPIITHNTVTGGSTDVKILLEIVGGKYHPCPTLNSIVQYNTITETRNDVPQEANAAVRVRCAKGTTFTNNTVRSTGTAIGLYMRDESDGGTYTNNTFWTHSEEALRMASGNVDKTFPANNLFRNNVFHSDAGPSTFIQGIAGGNVFQNNIFWANVSGSGGTISGGFGNTYDHNTFFNPLGWCQTMSYRDTPADVYTNNIFACGYDEVFRFDGYAANRINADYNLYYLTHGPTNVAYQQSMTDWRASSAAAGSADDAHSKVADPLLVDPLHGNFALATNSPARHAGSDGSDLGVSGLSSSTILPPSTPGATTKPTPSISIIHPTGKSFAHRILTITTSVKDASGGSGIAKVRFYLNGRLFFVDTKAPYATTIDTQVRRDGFYVIRAEVVGKNGTSAHTDRLVGITNTFQTRLTTSLHSPVLHGVVDLAPRFIYGGARIASVAYYRTGSKLIGVNTKAPYHFRWDTRTVKNGLYVITIRITDVNGKVAKASALLRVRN